MCDGLSLRQRSRVRRRDGREWGQVLRPLRGHDELQRRGADQGDPQLDVLRRHRQVARADRQGHLHRHIRRDRWGSVRRRGPVFDRGGQVDVSRRRRHVCNLVELGHPDIPRPRTRRNPEARERSSMIARIERSRRVLRLCYGERGSVVGCPARDKRDRETPHGVSRPHRPLASGASGRRAIGVQIPARVGQASANDHEAAQPTPQLRRRLSCPGFSLKIRVAPCAPQRGFVAYV